MIPSLTAAALETERRCFLNVIFASNVTPNITRYADSFSTVPSIVNGVDWGWIVSDLDYHSLSLICIQFHSPQVTPHTNPVQIKIHGLCNSYSLSSAGYKGNNCGSKTHPWGTPDTTLTSWLQQPYTTIYYDWLETLLETDRIEPPTPTAHRLTLSK